MMPTAEQYDAAKQAFEILYAAKQTFDACLQACEARGLTIEVDQVPHEVRASKTVNTQLQLTWQFSDTIR